MKKSIFFISIFLVLYFLVAAYNAADWDLWARLAVGKIVFDTGWILKHDIFAYTPTKPLWVDHEWLSGVAFYWLASNFSDLGLALFKIFAMFAIFLSIYGLNKLKFPEQNHYKIIYYPFFLYALITGFSGTVRSQAFTYIFFALWMYLLELVKRGNNRLLLIFPVTMLFWANAHGGFVAGIGLLGLYGIGEALNKRSYLKYFATAGVSALVTLINPYGFKYWTYLAEAITMTRPFVTEWRPIELFGPFTYFMRFKIFALITLIAFLYIILSKSKLKITNLSQETINVIPNLFRNRTIRETLKQVQGDEKCKSVLNKNISVNWAEIIILVVIFWLSIQHIRHTVFFIIVAAGYSTGYLYEFLKIKLPYSGTKLADITCKVRDAVIYTLIVAIGFLTILFVPLKVKVENHHFPVRAVKFIQDNKLSGNLLVLFNWGSYALWKLYPQCKISLDGRYEEVYPEWLVNEVARFHYVGKGLSWMDVLKKYKNDMILMDTHCEVYKNLLMLDNWKVVYKDKYSAVFVPKSLDKKNWIIPDEKYIADDDKFNTQAGVWKLPNNNKSRIYN